MDNFVIVQYLLTKGNSNIDTQSPQFNSCGLFFLWSFHHLGRCGRHVGFPNKDFGRCTQTADFQTTTLVFFLLPEKKIL